MNQELVILVDAQGRPIGQSEKLAAHQDGGVLHLGFSILIFNKKGEILLQKRASGKYHFADLWSNSCCGHPRPGEETLDAAERRLSEEFGFTTELTLLRVLSYQADDPRSGLAEKEHLTVFFGSYDQEPNPDPAEIGDWRWENLDDFRKRVSAAPGEFTPWFLLLKQEIDLQAVADLTRSG